MYQCPECQKELKSKRSLDNHRAKYHNVAVPLPAPSVTVPAKEPAKVPAEEEGDLQINVGNPGKVYQCADCGAPVTRDMPACPECGETLVWEMV